MRPIAGSEEGDERHDDDELTVYAHIGGLGGETEVLREPVGRRRRKHSREWGGGQVGVDFGICRNLV
jgi:hypothetical protein